MLECKHLQILSLIFALGVVSPSCSEAGDIASDAQTRHVASDVRPEVRLAQSGDPEAQANLGYNFLVGDGGFDRNIEMAVYWLSLAADQGVARAQNNLGILYRVGNGVEKDQQRALQLFEAAAEQGEMNAQTNLAGMYERGEGVAPDMAQAVRWYRAAALAGNPSAQRLLGGIYQDALGVPRDCEAAMHWFAQATAGGDDYALIEIADSHRLGNCVEADADEAARWYRRAALAGEPVAPVALYNLAVLLVSGETQAVANETAPDLYFRSACAGYGHAEFALGALFATGTEVPMSLYVSEQWLKIASEDQSVSAARRASLALADVLRRLDEAQRTGASEDQASGVRLAPQDCPE